MAFGLEDTCVIPFSTILTSAHADFIRIHVPLRSRLGCQCKITRELDGMTVQLPSATRNFAVDGENSYILREEIAEFKCVEIRA